jgi:hypothetical protein
MINQEEIVSFYERYPHIKDRIQLTWGTAQCHRCLIELLNDTRDGERKGFSRLDSKVIFALLDDHDKKFPYYDSSIKYESPFHSYNPVPKVPPRPVPQEDADSGIYWTLGAVTTMVLTVVAFVYGFYFAPH